ncbi:MAG: hypothetical protein QOF74_3301, partial [Caballeronia mineralivorans]|nr:hypothetical protein [Caballeronia mineralivorans]
MTPDQAVPGGSRSPVASGYDIKELTRTYSKVFWR